MVYEEAIDKAVNNISRGLGRMRNEPELPEERNNVIHPNHYTDGGIETIDFICAKTTPEEFQGFCKCTVIKYIARAGKKGATLSDIAKAFSYLGWWYASAADLLGIGDENKLQPSEVIADLDLAGMAETWKTGI